MANGIDLTAEYGGILLVGPGEPTELIIKMTISKKAEIYKTLKFTLESDAIEPLDPLTSIDGLPITNTTLFTIMSDKEVSIPTFTPPPSGMIDTLEAMQKQMQDCEAKGGKSEYDAATNSAICNVPPKPADGEPPAGESSGLLGELCEKGGHSQGYEWDQPNQTCIYKNVKYYNVEDLQKAIDDGNLAELLGLCKDIQGTVLVLPGGTKCGFNGYSYTNVADLNAAVVKDKSSSPQLTVSSPVPIPSGSITAGSSKGVLNLEFQAPDAVLTINSIKLKLEGDITANDIKSISITPLGSPSTTQIKPTIDGGDLYLLNNLGITASNNAVGALISVETNPNAGGGKKFILKIAGITTTGTGGQSAVINGITVESQEFTIAVNVTVCPNTCEFAGDAVIKTVGVVDCGVPVAAILNSLLERGKSVPFGVAMLLEIESAISVFPCTLNKYALPITAPNFAPTFRVNSGDVFLVIIKPGVLIIIP
mgnify:CR=1 FL=1